MRGKGMGTKDPIYLIPLPNFGSRFVWRNATPCARDASAPIPFFCHLR